MMCLSLTETLEREKQLNAALLPQKANLEEKKEQEKKLDNLNMKRPWVVRILYLA